VTVDLSHMNESQRVATEWQDGAMLVLAGPGSGKTRVLIYRIARLIDERPEARFRVLGVTFTNKAASEMRSRIDSLVTVGRERVHLATFHAFAADILRQHGSHIGLRPDFMILSEQADREAVLGEAIAKISNEDEDYQPRASQLLPVIDRLLDECIPATEAGQALKNSQHADTIAAIYAEYCQSLIGANQLDFGSLLAFAVELLENKEAVAGQIRRIYSYVCVDEFQDTNAAQYRFLLQIIAPSKPNLFVVADDDQLIYQWNGANPARLRTLRDQFDMKIVQLPVNFRCPPEVIRLANSLIQNNDNRSPDKLPLVSDKPSKEGRVIVKGFDDVDAEFAWLASRIIGFPAAQRSECVVLARRKKLLDYAIQCFEQHDLPAHLAVRKNEFQSAPFRWLHSMLRLANARGDREQVRRVSRAFAQIEGISIEVGDVVARAAADSIDFLRAWIALALERRALEPSTRALLIVAETSLLDRLDCWPFIDAAVKWFTEVEDLPRDPEQRAFDEYVDEAAAWSALVQEIGNHFSLKDMALHQFLQELDLRAKEVPPPRNAVRCLTIHGAKGTEFKHVFLVGMVEDELPSWAAKQKGDDSDEMREERRECFVAITRAAETLTLTHADEYFGWAKEPSRFLAEMGVL